MTAYHQNKAHQGGKKLIVAKLPKEEFTCYMCKKYKMRDNPYIYRTFHFEKKPSIEFRICRKCAKREWGDKNKHNLENIIGERTEKWLKQNHQGLKELRKE